MRVIRALTIALTLTAAFASSAIAGDAIAWHNNLDAARKASRESGKPLLLYITSSHCAFCVKMQNETFRNPAVIAEVNSHFVPVMVDREAQTAIERNLSVRSYPTTSILDEETTELKRIGGYVAPTSFVQTLKTFQGEWIATHPRPGTIVK